MCIQTMTTPTQTASSWVAEPEANNSHKGREPDIRVTDSLVRNSCRDFDGMVVSGSFGRSADPIFEHAQQYVVASPRQVHLVG
jgi:hypothetical protein